MEHLHGNGGRGRTISIQTQLVVWLAYIWLGSGIPAKGKFIGA